MKDRKDKLLYLSNPTVEAGRIAMPSSSGVASCLEPSSSLRRASLLLVLGLSKIAGLSVSKPLVSPVSKVKGLTLRLGGILVTGTSGGGVVFFREVKFLTLFTFLLGEAPPDLLSSSGSSCWLLVSSLLTLCLFLCPVATTLGAVGALSLSRPAGTEPGARPASPAGGACLARRLSLCLS